MLQLASVLHSHGFSITICHPQFNSPDPSTHPHFEFIPLRAGFTPQNAFKSLTEFLKILNDKSRTPFMDTLVQIMGKEEQSACHVIYDGCMYFAAQVANELNLPSFVFHTFSAANLLRYLAYPHLRQEGLIPIQDSKLLEPVPDLDPLRFKDLFLVSNEDLDAWLNLLSSFCDIKSSSAMIFNTADLLEQQPLKILKEKFQVPIFSIGPIHKISPPIFSSLVEEDTSCISWLDMQTPNSVLYISLGSLNFLNDTELTEMAWGLANSKQPFLWVVPPEKLGGSRSLDSLPEGFEEAVGERSYLVKWAPQKKVLAHGAVGGFLSHCGWNSTLESIGEGVPMICRASYGDQKVNARYLSHVWRVGVELEKGLEREKIESAVRRLMRDEEGEGMRKRALDLKEMIRICVGDGGSSSESIAELVKLIMSSK